MKRRSITAGSGGVRHAGQMAAMTRQEAIDFLAMGSRTGKLATASPAGEPHVAPVWFVVDGDDLVFTTAVQTVKGRNLRANPRAALTVDVSEYPYGFAVVRGPVGLEEQAPDLLAWTTRIAGRYVPARLAPDYGRRNAVDGELLCRLRIDRISGAGDVAL
jgi:PPOX class probable F420-dependent enzyme